MTARKTRSPLAKSHTVHKYVRIEPKHVNGSAIYRCVIPGCRHYLREEYFVGQIAACYFCNGEFEVTKEVFFPRKIKKVHCPNCKRPTFNRRTGMVQAAKPTLTTEQVEDILADIIHGRGKDD